LVSTASEWKGRWITSDLPRYDASWITTSPAAVKTSAYVYSFDLPKNARIRSAEIYISAEGGFTFFVNGKQARQASNRPNGWKKPVRGDFGEFLIGGKNTFAIAVPAVGKNALIAFATIELDDSSHIEINPDAS
jgi:hypothetical protein